MYLRLRNLFITLVITTLLTGCNSSSDEDSSSTGQSNSPTISLYATPETVLSGGSITLNWESDSAVSCTASGDWSGSRGITGLETISSLTSNSHFVLSCSNSNGSTTETVDVTVTMSGSGTALISWAPPTENIDGSVLTDLDGYRIYYGAVPGHYTEMVSIDNPGISSYQIDNLTPADWYFVVVAVNALGVESNYSEEVGKTIN